MATDTDPYRTLGLERGASLEEVKRAYRRLAKANHPDAAGESALPRFLAIQAAYDQIAGPDGGSRRGVGRDPAGAQPPRAWDADPDRAGATHRAYGGRPRPRPGPRPGTRPGTGPRPDRPPRGDRADRPDRPPKKATLGSTSYDDVDTDAFDPDWGGASWYGTTSGTYWTLNPKEYADPRKHGPEYQARARRAGQGRQMGDEAAPPPPRPAPPAAGTAPSIGVDAADGATAPPPPTHTTSSWWEATTAEPSAASGPATDREPARPTAPRERRSTHPIDERPALSMDTIIASIRGWLDEDRPTGVGRIGRAAIGWAPIAVGAGWLAGEISGCGRFAATCPPTIAPLTWIVQLGLLLLLIVLPRLARITSVAAIAILGTVFPASLLLFATGDPEGMAAGRSILGGLMIVAWVAGLAYGIAREVRRGTRPVS